MDPRRWLIMALLGAACVDLGRPLELSRPPATPGDGGETASVDAGAAVPADASIDLTSPGAPADAAVIGADADSPDIAIPADTALPIDAAIAADLPVPPDAAAPATPDAAAPPPDASVPPDLAPPPVDLAPDRAPDLSPDLPRDLAPDLPPDVSPDLGPPALVIDDFQTANLPNRNNLNSEVSQDNQICNKVDGEMICVYDGSGGYHDFIETLANWCGYPASIYKKFRFRMRTSVPGEMVDVFAGTNSGGCSSETQMKIGTITTTTTMTTYELDISALTASKQLVKFEFDPKSTSATTQFILDDLQLAP
jgi:hypothetical protein